MSNKNIEIANYPAKDECQAIFYDGKVLQVEHMHKIAFFAMINIDRINGDNLKKLSFQERELLTTCIKHAIVKSQINIIKLLHDTQ